MLQFSLKLNAPEEEFEKAREFLEKGEIEKAGRLFQKIIEKFPDFLPGYLEYADFLLNLELPFEALSILRNGFRISPQDFEFRYLWAVALQKCWLLNLAEKEFEFLKSQKPNDSEILRQIGWTKVLKGEVEEGRRILREEETKKLLLILAHQGTREAISLLKDYSKMAEKELSDWVKLVLEECKIFSKAKPEKMVKIFHKF